MLNVPRWTVIELLTDDVALHCSWRLSQPAHKHAKGQQQSVTHNSLLISDDLATRNALSCESVLTTLVSSSQRHDSRASLASPMERGRSQACEESSTIGGVRNRNPLLLSFPVLLNALPHSPSVPPPIGPLFVSAGEHLDMTSPTRWSH